MLIRNYWGMFRAYFFLEFMGWTLLWVQSAWPCPLCHTETAIEVRVGIVDTIQNRSVLLGITLPFLLIAIMLILINSNYFQSFASEGKKGEKHD